MTNSPTPQPHAEALVVRDFMYELHTAAVWTLPIQIVLQF